MSSRPLRKRLPGRSLLRPIKRLAVIAPMARAVHRRKWAGRWRDGDHMPWMTQGAAPELVEAVESGWLPAGATLLDLGCGNGVSAAWLAERGFDVTGVDFADGAIEQARKTYGDVPRLRFDTVDVSDPAALADRTFGALVDRGCLHGIPWSARAGYAANVARWTEPGAPFLLTMAAGRQSGQEIIDTVLAPAFDVEDVGRVDVLASKGERSIAGRVYRLRRRQDNSTP